MSLCTNIRKGKSVCLLCPGIPPKADPGPRGPLLDLLSDASSTLRGFPSTSTPFRRFTALKQRTKLEAYSKSNSTIQFFRIIVPSLGNKLGSLIPPYLQRHMYFNSKHLTKLKTTRQYSLNQSICK